MSTRCPASAAHSTARLPGSSRTVVRIRHSAVSRGAPSAPETPSVSPVPPVSRSGGAWLWRRAHQVWNAAVATSASAEATSRNGPSGPCATRFASPSATATAVNSAASSTRSRRQW